MAGVKGIFFDSVVVLCIVSGICSAQAARVEPLELPADSSVPQAVRKQLDTKGYRITLDDGTVACEIWLRKSVPGSAKPSASDALYGHLAESTLVAVISFPKATTDYRGQPIKAGVYTLRYELLPNDGNHLGVAPNRDFLLLVPAASDTDPDATFKFEDLVNLSRQATGTRHPGPLGLVQAAGGAPSISKDDEDHWIFSANLKLASGQDLPFSLVVRGTAPQ
jgi:hypothetical protein